MIQLSVATLVAAILSQTAAFSPSSSGRPSSYSSLSYSSSQDAVVDKADCSAFLSITQPATDDEIATAYLGLSSQATATATAPSSSIASLDSSLSTGGGASDGIPTETTDEEEEPLPFFCEDNIQDHDGIGDLQEDTGFFFPPPSTSLRHRKAMQNALQLDMFFGSGTSIKNEWTEFS